MPNRHYVDFFSYGIDGSLVSHIPVTQWNVLTAAGMALTIFGPQGQRPFGFRFSTWDDKPNGSSSLVAISQAYFFGPGEPLTKEQIQSGDYYCKAAVSADANLDGMRRIATVRNGKQYLELFRDGDVILPPLT